jgi:Melibiase/Alpha galactosidase C-terminal beta sandwich domain
VKLSTRSLSAGRETVSSWWNVGLFGGYDREGMVLGYLGNPSSLGQLLVSKTGPDHISFLAESVYSPAVILRPGARAGSDRFMLSIAADPYAALAVYAAAAGALHNARTTSIVNGWCSWFYTLQQVSEDEVLANAAFAAKHLKPFGLEYIQIDEGYQRWHGDWEGNERFPHGMKWLADRIRSHGFKPGLWISPFVIAEPTQVFKTHPEWLVHKPDGALQRIGNWPDENSELARNENPKQYCLDITHSGAARWLSDLFKTIAGDWGYDMIKIDFMAWSVFGAHRFHDPTVSSAQVYRRGLEIMRNAIGDRCHLLDCGPGAITIGLIDSMRIEADINYGYSEAEWKTYFLDPACSAAAVAKRHYLHKRTWVNDADHICMNLLTNQESEAAATIIALSGGNMISGDRLTELDEYRLEVLKKITPSAGETAVPVDLFDSDTATTYVIPIKRSFGEWTVVGFFNASRTKPATRKFSLRRLGLDPKKTYLAFDFWRQKSLGDVTGAIEVPIAPGSVTLLALHEKLGRPQLLSTDRHVLQGAVEVENVTWDEKTKTLAGVSTGPIGTAHNVSIYVPGEHPWTWGGYVLFRDKGSYDLKLVENSVIRVHVRFDKSTRVEWQVQPDEFFK